MQWFLSIFATLMFAATGFCADPWIGTWRFNSSKSTEERHPELTFEPAHDGYRVLSNTAPVVNVRFDAEIPATTKGYTTRSYHRIDRQTYQVVFKLKDQIVRTTTFKVSSDHQELTVTFKYMDADAVPSPAIRTNVYHRVGPEDKRDPFIGKWSLDDERTAAISPEVVHFESTPDGKLKANYGGFWFEAGYDGRSYPVKGPSRDDEVVLERVDERTLKTIWKRDGKVAETFVWTVAPDGKTVTATGAANLPGAQPLQAKRVFDRQ